MKIAVIVIFTICFKNYIRCNVNDYAAANSDEDPPPFETIIFTDLVDVINEFNDLNSGFDSNVPNYSEDGDSIDDLVSKYQSFLDRAHKQRIKPKQTKSYNFKDISYDIEPRSKHDSKGLKLPKKLYPFLSDPYLSYKKELIKKTDRHPKITSLLNILDSCYCEDNVFPCKCVPPINTNTNAYEEYFKDYLNNDLTKGNLNINVNVKMPEFIETLTNILSKIFEGNGREDILSTNDRHAILSYKQNPLTSYFSMTSLPYNTNSHVYEPTINNLFYKKKNRHLNKALRKRKNKNPLTARSIGLDELLERENKIYNNTKSNIIKEKMNMINNSKVQNVTSSIDISQNLETNKSIDISNNNTKINVNKIENSTESTDNVIFNVASKIVVGNVTEYFPKLGNSIEKFDVTQNEATILRHRRQIEPIRNNTEVTKDIFKFSTNDDKLLYWPHYNSINSSITYGLNDTPNSSVSVIPIQVNITNNKLIRNITIAIDKQIFNETDGNDINTVAREFVYFVGKYLNGIFTLCSESVCHSFKCANKTCLERKCKPQERFNAKGHCTVKQNTDTSAAVSVADVPLTKAFKLIDDLKSKMAGKLFGKASMCVSQKCVTFAANEKSFLKSTCTSKELTAKGHCPNIK